ncbi:metallophosphoesterase family protein [Anaeromyxobacter oryzae]|uniref:Metallophosphoesterase n=1 Tax=Anaeromyxobacter oryzae TaxID=2918170 RepID=A0ABN6MT28_9BACT|nr:metallophosphoesterase [Anaeromyxobacter oryzae]BDG04127.1 metallophosphoesterase [Anaeromyxobacter oryzae]
MRIVAHLSDLHFGKEDPPVVRALAADLAAVRPALVIVSGDLTQRARPREFLAARAFLAALPAPALVVPGNHDVPLFQVIRRFVSPLGRWRRYLGPETEPVFLDDELVVVGVSTARSNVWKEGRINEAQISRALEAYRAAPGRVKVLVAHHPFAPPAGALRARVAGRSPAALQALEAEGLDLVLTGHLHHGHAGDVRDTVHALAQSVLTVHASTATSVRRRDEPNAYNVLALSPGRIRLEVRAFEGGGFRPSGRVAFARGPGGWERGDASAP